MKTKYTLKFVALLAVAAAVALFAGCKKQEAHNENDGHDHSGHAHGSPKAPAQTNQPSTTK